MRNLLIAAALIIGIGSMVPELADRMISARSMASSKPASMAMVVDAASSDAGYRTLNIPRDSRGHFETEARIDGQRIDFMVDTGATVVALNERSAARFGLRPTPGDFKAVITTANGTVRGARTRLAMMDVGGIVVRDVDALVLPDEALSENLLGLSFLSKLKRFQYANGAMVLEQ